MAKGSSVFAAVVLIAKAAGEYRRSVARPLRGWAAGTCDADEAAPMDSGMNTWRAGCSGSCTSGSEGGPGKPTSRKADRAPRSDPYTYIPTKAGFLYLAAVIDVWSRRVVGWSMRNDLTTPLVTDAPDHGPRTPHRVIHHSDRGSQTRFKGSSQRCLVGGSVGVR